MMAAQIDHLKIQMDFRGIVFEPIDPENLRIQCNTHIVISRPGIVRGNHYHLIGVETVAVLGRALVRIKKNDDIQDVKVPPNTVCRFIIPPKVSHAFKNTDDQHNILVCFNSCKYDSARSLSLFLIANLHNICTSWPEF